MSEAMRRSERPQAAFGEAVRELRQKAKATQEEIAAGAGITPQTLSLIERGHANPTWDTARKLAAALGVSIGELAKLSEKHE